MPTSKVQSSRPVVPPTEAPARKPSAAKAKAVGSPSAGIQAKTDSGKKAQPGSAESPSERIDARIRDLGDWRGETLSRLRALIKEADPEVTEEWKWSIPVWSHCGIICTGETYKKVVKMTFAKGAALSDPSKLFNSSLEGNVRRAIDFHEGDPVDEAALKALIRAAVALNQS